MTKSEIISELSLHNYDGSFRERYDTLRRRLSEARYSKRQHYASWRKIFRSVKTNKP